MHHIDCLVQVEALTLFQYELFFHILFSVVETEVDPNWNPFTIPPDNDIFMLRDKERQKKKQV